MRMQTTQVKVTLPVQLQSYLRIKSDRYGLTMSSYVKNLIINDVKDVSYPVYRASKQVEKDYKEARKAEKQDKLVKVSDLDDFLSNL